MQDSPDGLVPTKDFVDNCLRPNPDFNDGSLLGDVPVRDEYGREGWAATFRPPQQSASTRGYSYSVLEFSQLIDSSSMDGDHWNRMFRCLASNWDAFDAVVILHGTDTLAYTASVLSFMLPGHLDKTVIVTGSQLSIYANNNDAHDNLLDSLTVASTYKVPEVSVVFHHHLYRATRVTKVSSFSVAGFTTPNAKPLATFPRIRGKPWTASVHSETIRPVPKDNTDVSSTDISGLIDVNPNLKTDRAAVLKVYPGISASLISSITNIPDLGGLVLETFGAGNIPTGNGDNGLLHTLSTAVAKGIVVVSVTQCTFGTLDLSSQH